MNDHKKPQRDTGFTLRDLIDLEQLRDLFARFTGIAGFPVVLVAYPDQELLIGNGRWDICASFRHRPPNPSAPCQLDDPTFATGPKSTSDVQIQQCVCGLISGAVSVLVDGRTLATLFSGQVLLSPPDWQQLKQRGAISGYDPAAYLAALRAAPIVTEAQLKKGLTYLRDMSAALAEQGLARLDSLQMMHLAAQNEKRYRLLAENTTDVIWTMDLNLNSTYTSPSVTRLRGYDAATAMNQSLAETLTPDSLVIVNQALREELAREALPQKDLSRFRVLQLEILHKDGHIIPIETTVTFLRDDFGRPVEILGVTRDISARKQAEAAILKSKERAQRQRNALVALAFDPAIANGDQLRAAQNLAQAAADALEVPRVSVWLLAQNGTEMRCIEQYDALTQEHSPGTTLNSQDYPTYWRIMRQDNLISVEDAQYDQYTNELDDDYLSPLGITSMLDAGIQVDGELVGVICLEHIGPKRVWQAGEQVFANTIAGLMAQTLINARRKWVEEQLRQAQETYRGLLDSTTELIYVQDEQGVILDVNQTVSAVYDIPRQEIIGQKPEFLAAPGKNDLAKLAEQHRLAFLGKPQTLEFWGRKRNGAIFPKEVILAPSTYFGQKVVIAVARDISKNKQAEELLKRSKANLNAILENPLESVWSIDTEYKIQYVNKSFSQMFYQCFGVSLVTGMSLLEHLPAATRDRWKAQAERAFHNEHFVFQDKFDAGESPIYIEVAVNPIKIDGRIVGASFYSRDITAQTLTNQQIQYETELRKLLIELSTDFINLPLDQLAESIQRSMADLGQFVDVDRVYLFAYDFAAQVAINTYEWCAPGIKPEIDNLQSVPMANYPEWLEQHQKGNPVWIPDVDALPEKNPDGVWGILKAQNIKSLITIPMLGNGRLLGFVGFDSVRQQHHYTDYERQLLQLYAQMLVNVMERIETEEQMKKAQEDVARLQKLESVGTLAGGIAHDFNNLLTGLFSNLNLAQRHLRPDHPASSALARAEQAIERAKRLTMQMLTFAHGGDPVREVSDIGALLQETIYFDLSGSNVQASISCPPDLYPAEVDRGQIQQAISNLTINAMQAMPTGGQLSIVLGNVELSAGDVAHLPPGRYVQITFQDEGAGIEPRHLDRIFDPYFSTKQTGSGLGLAVTHSIINKHGGHIAITSQPGRGTTATLYLPALMTKLPIEAISPAPTAPSEALRPARILVMDDEEILRSAVAELLELEGYEVVTVANGEEAFAAYQLSLEEGQRFSAIIMDLTIPGGMGGQEAVQAILRLDPQARCIASSGYATDPIMANYAQYGFRGVVKKPYNFRQLQETLAEVIESSDS